MSRGSPPEISVVLPVHNARRTIGRAVRSILSQTHEDFELIVVDDGSSDGTADALKPLLSDRRMSLCSIAHRGVAGAANHATKLARGRLIARMDSDDWSHPRRLQLQRAYLNTNGCDVVGSRVQIVDVNQHRPESLRRYETWVNEETATAESILALRFVEFPLVNPSILARREYFELRFRDGDFPEDYELMLRAAEAGMRFGKVPENLLQWSDHPNRLTRQDPRFSEQAFLSCRQKFLLRGPLCNSSIVDLWGWGRAGKPWVRFFKSSGIGIRYGYDVSPRRIGETIHGVEIRAPQTLAPADGTPLVIAVGAAGARPTITSQVTAAGYTLGGDAWFVA